MWQTKLVIEGDELEIHHFYSDEKYSSFCHDISYYYVKVWIIILQEQSQLGYTKGLFISKSH
jgi:hypothetical protein